MFHARDRLDIDLFCLVIHDNMECFVKAKLANTKFFIKFGHDILKFLITLRILQGNR